MFFFVSDLIMSDEGDSASVVMTEIVCRVNSSFCQCFGVQSELQCLNHSQQHKLPTENISQKIFILTEVKIFETFLVTDMSVDIMQ